MSYIYQKQQISMFGTKKDKNCRFSVVPEDDDEVRPEKYEAKIVYKDMKEEDLIKSENI